MLRCWCRKTTSQRLLAERSPGASLYALFINSCRVSGDKTAFGHVLHDDASRRNDATIPNPHPRQDDRVGADVAPLADPRFDVTAFYKIVTQDYCAVGDSGITPYVQAAWIGLIEMGSCGYDAVGTDIHFPYGPIDPQLQCVQPAAKPIAQSDGDRSFH